MLNGWGVWVESVEITEVRISSNTLFENMQIEFRENQRNRAEMIKMNVNNQIENEKLAKETELNKKQTDQQRDIKIYECQQQYKVDEEGQKIKNMLNELEKKKLDDYYLIQKFQKEQEMKYEQEK